VKTLTVKILLQLLFILGICKSTVAQNLDPNLIILQPLIDKSWIGELKPPNGNTSWKTKREFKTVWDGSIIKYSGSTEEINSFAEGFFYWDREEQKIAVLIVNNKGIYQKGFVTIADGIITINGSISFPERKFEFRNTFEITNDGKMIDRWYQNAFGKWQAGHIIEFSGTTDK